MDTARKYLNTRRRRLLECILEYQAELDGKGTYHERQGYTRPDLRSLIKECEVREMELGLMDTALTIQEEHAAMAAREERDNS